MRFLVGAWLLLAACGRIGFERDVGADAPAVPVDVRTTDAAPDDAHAMGCVYLTSCMTGQVTCCTNMNMTRMCVQNPQSCNGVVAECDLGTSQGCPVSWPCCQTGTDPAPRCYDPQLPVPC